MPNKDRKRVKRISYSIIGGIAVAAITVGSSVYAKRVLNPSELVHFFVPFPVGKVVRPMTVPKPDGKQIFTRPLIINVDHRGILKRILNPGLEGVSTHWLINVDSQPHRIGMRLTNVNVPVRWDVGAGIDWDPESQTFADAIPPGDSVPDLGVDWIFDFPPEVRAQNIWHEGALVIFDADSGEDLTVIPLKFHRGETR